MKRIWIANWICILAPCFMLCISLSSEEPNCNEVSAMARMTNATSSTVLKASNHKAGHSYRAQVVFAARNWEMHPKRQNAARRLLSLIPKDDRQHVVWMTFGDSLCDTEPVSEMVSLDRLGERLPYDLASAILIVPSKMKEYIAYSIISTQDPLSDYAIQMRSVCRAKHSIFMKAVTGLPADEKDQLVKRVFDPDTCRAIDLPEAE